MSNSTSFSGGISAAEYHRRQAAIPTIDFSQRRVVDANGHYLTRTPYSPESSVPESPFTMSSDSSAEFSMESPTPAARNVVQNRVPLASAGARRAAVSGHRRVLTPLAFDRCKFLSFPEASRVSLT
jgi:hypothetical protein